MKRDEKFACKLRREFRFPREPVMLERSKASLHQGKFKTEVHKYKRELAIGNSNTTLGTSLDLLLQNSRWGNLADKNYGEQILLSIIFTAKDFPIHRGGHH